MSKHHYIAVDLGAESGRVMLGTLENGKLTLDEQHRFANEPVELAGHRRWNILQLWKDIITGIGKATYAADGPTNVRSISCDSWAVDYVLVGKSSPMLSPPVQYRDSRTDATFKRALRDIGTKTIFDASGIQFLPFNTLYQLMSEPTELIESAETFVLIADWVNWQLAGGAPKVELSNASTTQIWDVRKRAWSNEVVEQAGLPKHVFPEVVEPGSVLGKHDGIKIIASCSHDTGCAVAAAPGDGANWAYLSSGTWSLIGVELDKPVVTDQCRELNFTNEQGYRGTTRLLKNISGLYILQQCRGAWTESDPSDQTYEYAELAQLGTAAKPLVSLIRPEHPDFAKPGRMPEKIADYCRRTDQPVPDSVGAYVRCIYESLALLYRKALGDLRELAGREIETLHIVGGGTQATLLNQLAADACGIPVVTGPVEATALGNMLIQAATLGDIDPDDIRPIVRTSIKLQTYEPNNTDAMNAAYEQFAKLPTE
ncbi:MAG: rhamnulokinase family protein [Planctomycetota bacterium]